MTIKQERSLVLINYYIYNKDNSNEFEIIVHDNLFKCYDR